MANKIRCSQLITTQGIGAIVTDKENESFLILSTDNWVYLDKYKYLVDEPRLKAYLGVKRLLKPPYDDNKDAEKEYVKTIRFPTWHFCADHRCKRLQQVGFEQNLGACTNHNFSHFPRLTPVRFLSVCENGHIDDFPFQEWVHGDLPFNGHELVYEERADSTGLAGIVIKCMTCGMKKSMQGALSPDSLQNVKKCTGKRLWLYNGIGKRNVEEQCNIYLQGAQKAASNVYLPVIRNSIFIPKANSLPANIDAFINNHVYVDTVKQVISNPELSKTVIKSLGSFNDEDTNTVFGLIIDASDPKPLHYNDIKEEEYFTFKKGSYKKSNDFDCTTIAITKFEAWFPDLFSSISIIEKLRDTRAYLGFTRVKPFDEYDRTVRSLINQITVNDELPVDVVRGEGIFIEFNHKSLDKWNDLPTVKKRMKRFPVERQNELSRLFRAPANFILLHTFAHVLINELCLVSGYNNSSIKERIYATEINGNEMNGILIYTNSGDSEGSLGGLVRNGKPGMLEPLIASAVLKADWCSSDPVCNEVIPQGYQGSNLAACHNCCLLPETACENMNHFLDRGLLRGSLNDNSFGFFKALNIKYVV